MKEKRPLISIIVPIYNTEKYLDKCIKSICDQSYDKLEIILINDGSSDKSLDICKRYEKNDARIKVITQINRGLIETRKIGLVHATGELIGFVDSDDWIERDMYMQLISIQQKTNADLVSSGIIHDYEFYNEHKGNDVFDNYNKGLYVNLDQDIYPTMLYDASIHRFGLNCNLVNKLFKKELLKKTYKDINPNIFYGEDCLALYTYCLLSKSVYIEKKAYYHYNIRSGSMCTGKDVKLLYNSYLLYSELKKKFYEYDDPYILMRQLRMYILKVEAHNMQMLYDINISSLGTWKFKYGQKIQNSKFIIYGAGGCGQAFYRYLCSQKMDRQIIAWVDKDYVNKSEQCLYKIESPDILAETQYDYIIIAVLKEYAAKSIQEEIVQKYQVEHQKILWEEPEYTPLFL